jgi:hypothetical protein
VVCYAQFVVGGYASGVEVGVDLVVGEAVDVSDDWDDWDGGFRGGLARRSRLLGRG